MRFFGRIQDWILISDHTDFSRPKKRKIRKKDSPGMQFPLSGSKCNPWMHVYDSLDTILTWNSTNNNFSSPCSPKLRRSIAVWRALIGASCIVHCYAHTSLNARAGHKYIGFSLWNETPPFRCLSSRNYSSALLNNSSFATIRACAVQTGYHDLWYPVIGLCQNLWFRRACA